MLLTINFETPTSLLLLCKGALGELIKLKSLIKIPIEPPEKSDSSENHQGTSNSFVKEPQSIDRNSNDSNRSSTLETGTVSC